MHPLVRDLYKRFLHVGRDYPRGLGYVREKAKTAIQNNAAMTDEKEIKLAVSKGRWWVNELIGVVQLKKYRAMRNRYGAGTLPLDVLDYDAKREIPEQELRRFAAEQEKDAAQTSSKEQRMT